MYFTFKGRDILDKVKKNLKYMGSLIITMLSLVLLIALMSSFVLLISKNNVADIFIIGLCCLSVILTNVYFLYILKKRMITNIPPLHIVLLIYNDVIFLSSIIPLFIVGEEQNKAGVKAVVTNIYVFYGATLVLMVVGFLLTIYLIKESIRKSNWWVFVASFPYIVTSWMIQRDYTSFKQFVHADNFTYKNVAKMLQDVDADMLLLNPSWYKFLSILIIILFLMMGMIAIENVWKKTSRWR